MKKTTITAAIIAATLTAGSIAQADSINGVHVTRPTAPNGQVSERVAISDSGVIYHNDNNVWYGEDGTSGIITPDALTTTQSTPDAVPTKTPTQQPVIEQKTPTPVVPQVEQKTPVKQETPTQKTPTPILPEQKTPTKQSEPAKVLPEQKTPTKTPSTVLPEQKTPTKPTTESKVNNENTTTKTTEEIVKGNTKTPERLRVQSNHNQSSGTHATTQTPAPTAQSTNQVPRNGNNVQPAAHAAAPAPKAKTVSTPKVDGDLISAQAEDFGGNKLPVTGSKDTLGAILTCFGIAIVSLITLHSVWVLTSPRRKRRNK